MLKIQDCPGDSGTVGAYGGALVSGQKWCSQINTKAKLTLFIKVTKVMSPTICKSKVQVCTVVTHTHPVGSCMSLFMMGIIYNIATSLGEISIISVLHSVFSNHAVQIFTPTCIWQ